MSRLQEKLAEIRMKIPALQKKKNSESVDYEFCNIDDVYRFLTPALNEMKVNFDVVKESASKQDANGSAVYFTWMPDAKAWIYEADLTVQWSDAESDEKETVEIHVVGTNESVPEKAKGTAWTYALKYYLFAKFSINQGGSMEDADMKDLTVKPTGTGKLKEAAKPKQPETKPGTVAGGEKEGATSSGKEVKNVQPKDGEYVKVPTDGNHGVENDVARPLNLEEAKQVVCGFGLNKGKTLGEIALNGAKGIADLTWFATKYGGRDERIKEAARILLDAADLLKAS